MSDTRTNVTPGWGPGHPRWPARWANMTPKMQAREHHYFRSSKARGHRFRSTGSMPRHMLEARDDRRRLAEALETSQ